MNFQIIQNINYKILSPGEGWDAVGVNCKRAHLPKMKALLPGIWAKLLRIVCLMIVWP